jgi:AcrR family transcriptional regulator
MEQIPTPPWRSVRRKSTKPQLSQDVIVDTALKVLDAEGLTAVTMRRVAEELNTGAASLYAHVGNKDELLDLVYDKVVGEIPIPEPDPERWSDQLRELCWKSYQVLSAHNDIALVAMANLPTGPNALRMGEAFLAITLAGGVPPQQAAWAIDRISLYIVADAYEGSLYQLRQKASGQSMEEFIEDYFGKMKAYYRSLPPKLFPATTEHLDVMMSGDGDERFGFGLEMMMRSLESFAVQHTAQHQAKGGKRSRV